MLVLVAAVSAAALAAEPLTVRVDLRGAGATEAPVVALYGDGTRTEARPADDGVAPDEVAGDGVYTGVVTVAEAKLGVALLLGAAETRGPKVRLDPAAPGVLDIVPRGGELEVRGGLELEPLSARPNAEGAVGSEPGAGGTATGADGGGGSAAVEGGDAVGSDAEGPGVAIGAGVLVVATGVGAWALLKRRRRA